MSINSLLFSIRAILAARLQGLATPLHASLAPTWRCNLSCAYCGRSRMQGAEMPPGQWFRIIRELAAAGCQRISFTGGEPLAYEGIFDLAYEGHRRGLHLTLNTNGLLVPEKISLIARAFDKVIISLDGDREIHDSLRGAGSYDAVIRAVQNLSMASVPIEFYAVVASDSTEAIEAVLDMARRFGTRVTFQPASAEMLAGLGNSGTIDLEAIRKALELVILAKDRGRPVANSRTGLLALMEDPFPLNFSCIGNLLFCRIEPNGVMRVCGRDPQPCESINVENQPVSEAFKQLKQPSCGVCRSAARLEMNLALQPVLEATWNLIRKRL